MLLCSSKSQQSRRRVSWFVVINQAYSLVRCEEIYTAANSRDGRGGHTSASKVLGNGQLTWSTPSTDHWVKYFPFVQDKSSRRSVGSPAILFSYTEESRGGWSATQDSRSEASLLAKGRMHPTVHNILPFFLLSAYQICAETRIAPRQGVSHRWQRVAALMHKWTPVTCGVTCQRTEDSHSPARVCVGSHLYDLPLSSSAPHETSRSTAYGSMAASNRSREVLRGVY
jgi:hypothetical protein